MPSACRIDSGVSNSGTKPIAACPAARSTRPASRGQHHRGQDIVRAQGLRDDVALDGAGAEPLQGRPDHLHRRQRSARLVGQPGGRCPDRPAVGELGGEHLEPLRRRQRRVVGGVGQAAVERGQRGVVLLGVLADVEGREVETEGGRPAQQAAHRPVRDHLAAMGAQRALQQLQLRHQLVGGQVVAARHVARVLGDAPAGVFQPATDEGSLSR